MIMHDASDWSVAKEAAKVIAWVVALLKIDSGVVILTVKLSANENFGIRFPMNVQ